MTRLQAMIERTPACAGLKEGAVAALLYGIVAGLLFPWARYRIDPDTISYLSIAQKYLRGEWTDAVNGFWGPFYSWLLLPFLGTGLDPLSSVAVLSMVLGAFALVGAGGLSDRFRMSRDIHRALTWALIPVFLYFSLSVRSPDLLVAGLLCFYFRLIFDPEYGGRRRDGFLCGTLGALAYLAKPYAFYFFIPHFILLSALRMHFTSDRPMRRSILKHLLIGLLVFSVLSGLWVTLLSQKYGRLTIGTAGSYNHARTHPASWGSFYLDELIVYPPNGSAVSIMEDPTGMPVPAWDPVESLGSMTYQATVIVKNIHDIVVSCSRFFPLTAAVLLGYLLLVASAWGCRRELLPVLFPVLTLLSFPAGYTFFVINERYLWILFILLILMGGHLLSLVLQHDRLTKTGVRRLAVLFFVLAFTIMPARALVKEICSSEAKDRYELSVRMGDRLRLSGRLLSDGEWAKSQGIAYHLGCPYYGAAGNELKKSNAAEILRGYGIDHVLLWHTPEEALPALLGYREVGRGEFPGLRIFTLNCETVAD